MFSPHTDFDASALAAVILGGYGIVIGIIASCGMIITRGLHDFAKECALDRHRQNEMIERLLIMGHDCETTDDEESEIEVDLNIPEQPPTRP